MPTRLLERLVEGIDDPELTSLRTEIALLDARMGELLDGLSDTGAAEAWQSVTGLVSQLRQAVENPMMQGREGVLGRVVAGLTSAVATESDSQQTWKEVYSIIDRRRRTTNVELKREEAAEFTLRHAQAVHFFQVLTAVIHEEVEDPGLRARLGMAVAREMNREPPQRLLEAGSAEAE